MHVALFSPAVPFCRRCINVSAKALRTSSFDALDAFIHFMRFLVLSLCFLLFFRVREADFLFWDLRSNAFSSVVRPSPLTILA